MRIGDWKRGKLEAHQGRDWEGFCLSLSDVIVWFDRGGGMGSRFLCRERREYKAHQRRNLVNVVCGRYWWNQWGRAREQKGGCARGALRLLLGLYGG